MITPKRNEQQQLHNKDQIKNKFTSSLEDDSYSLTKRTTQQQQTVDESTDSIDTIAKRSASQEQAEDDTETNDNIETSTPPTKQKGEYACSLSYLNKPFCKYTEGNCQTRIAINSPHGGTLEPPDIPPRLGGCLVNDKCIWTYISLILFCCFE